MEYVKRHGHNDLGMGMGIHLAARSAGLRATRPDDTMASAETRSNAASRRSLSCCARAAGHDRATTHIQDKKHLRPALADVNHRSGRVAQ